MSLGAEIRNLGENSLASLTASHNYYANAVAVWRFLQSIVSEGREFVVHNSVTGADTDQKSLVALTEHYISAYLTTASFQDFVSVFENFVFDLLRLWLIAYPDSLSEKQLKFGTVLKAPDKEAIAFAVVDRELNELKYERVAEWFEYLERRAGLGTPSKDVIDRLAEIKASRDILVHNKGIVNATYLSKAGSFARQEIGDRLEIPASYHQASWELINGLIRNVMDCAEKKLQD